MRNLLVGMGKCSKSSNFYWQVNFHPVVLVYLCIVGGNNCYLVYTILLYLPHKLLGETNWLVTYCIVDINKQLKILFKVQLGCNSNNWLMCEVSINSCTVKPFSWHTVLRTNNIWHCLCPVLYMTKIFHVIVYKGTVTNLPSMVFGWAVNMAGSTMKRVPSTTRVMRSSLDGRGPPSLTSWHWCVVVYTM